MSDLVERLRDADTTRRIGESYADTHERRQRDREEAATRIAQLEAALRAVMDDLTLIGENNWLPVGLLDDVIYVNALAALEERT